MNFFKMRRISVLLTCSKASYIKIEIYSFQCSFELYDG